MLAALACLASSSMQAGSPRGGQCPCNYCCNAYRQAGPRCHLTASKRPAFGAGRDAAASRFCAPSALLLLPCDLTSATLAEFELPLGASDAGAVASGALPCCCLLRLTAPNCLRVFAAPGAFARAFSPLPGKLAAASVLLDAVALGCSTGLEAAGEMGLLPALRCGRCSSRDASNMSEMPRVRTCLNDSNSPKPSITPAGSGREGMQWCGRVGYLEAGGRAGPRQVVGRHGAGATSPASAVLPRS